MRDKLVELIKKGGVIISETAEAVADHLIANNVFVLPEQMKDSWELALPFMMRLFVANEEEIAKIKTEFELSQKKQILTDIYNYLGAILDEWLARQLEPYFIENNIGVYNHIRKEMDDLIEYAKKLGVEL